MRHLEEWRSVMKHPCLFAVAAVLALGPTPATAATLILDYEGSFNLPPANGWGDHYARSVVFIPDGNARPGSARAVTGPSLLVWYHWAGHTVGFNDLPAPVEAGPLGVATWLRNANGGTESDGPGGYTYYPVDVCSAGNIWAGFKASGGGPLTALSNPGVTVLGGTSHAVSTVESGWPTGGFSLNAVLRRGDAVGEDYPTDGTDTGARFLVLRRPGTGMRIGGCWRTLPSAGTGTTMSPWTGEEAPVSPCRLPFLDFSEYTVLERALPQSTYVFHFGVDTDVNGVLDSEVLFYDSVQVDVTPKR
jgi:hypothetical protein